MRTAAALVLAALGLLSCGSPPPGGSSLVTLFGPGSRLEDWKTSVIDGVHVHPSQAKDPCDIPALIGVMEVMPVPLESPKREQMQEGTRKMGPLVEALCASSLGKSYGGPGRTAVLLRRFGAGASTPEEALIVDLPRLKPDETERLYKAGEFQAAYERPPRTLEATLERGWVRARRIGSDRTEFELFLVLKPLPAGATYESLQVVTRVETPAR